MLKSFEGNIPEEYISRDITSLFSLGNFTLNCTGYTIKVSVNKDIVQVKNDFINISYWKYDIVCSFDDHEIIFENIAHNEAVIIVTNLVNIKIKKILDPILKSFLGDRMNTVILEDTSTPPSQDDILSSYDHNTHENFNIIINKLNHDIINDIIKHDTSISIIIDSIDELNKYNDIEISDSISRINILYRNNDYDPILLIFGVNNGKILWVDHNNCCDIKSITFNSNYYIYDTKNHFNAEDFINVIIIILNGRNKK